MGGYFLYGSLQCIHKRCVCTLGSLSSAVGDNDRESGKDNMEQHVYVVTL